MNLVSFLQNKFKIDIQQVIHNKILIRNTAIYTIGDFLNVAINGFLLLPFYTRYLSQGEYGYFNIVNAFMTVITFIIHFGIISTYSRMYFIYPCSEKKKFTGHVMLIHLLSSLFLMLVVLVFQDTLLNNFFGTITKPEHYYYIFTVSVLSFINALYGIYLRINEEAYKFLIFQVSQVVLNVFFIFFYKAFFQDTLSSILLASFTSVLIIWLYALTKLKFIIRLEGLILTSKKVISFSFPIFIGYILVFFVNKFNILYLQKNETIENIALFSLALQLSSIINIFAGSSGKALQPLLFKLKEEEIIEKTKKMAIAYKTALTVLLVFFCLFYESLILLAGTEKYINSKKVLLLIALGSYASNFRAVESFLFFYFDKPRYSLYVISASAATVVALSMTLNQKLGYIGAGYAILCGGIISHFTNKKLYFKMLSERKIYP
ncbi:oligosaccharide flippase family protein [Dolichospermum sp. ST_sed1]|nr:oligosaccharide flippase family protein [Dolichospermum sp. ST_sed1]